jgi:hypothetical protein
MLNQLDKNSNLQPRSLQYTRQEKILSNLSNRYLNRELEFKIKLMKSSKDIDKNNSFFDDLNGIESVSLNMSNNNSKIDYNKTSDKKSTYNISEYFAINSSYRNRIKNTTTNNDNIMMNDNEISKDKYLLQKFGWLFIRKLFINSKIAKDTIQWNSEQRLYRLILVINKLKESVNTKRIRFIKSNDLEIRKHWKRFISMFYYCLNNRFNMMQSIITGQNHYKSKTIINSINTWENYLYYNNYCIMKARSHRLMRTLLNYILIWKLVVQSNISYRTTNQMKIKIAKALNKLKENLDKKKKLKFYSSIGNKKILIYFFSKIWIKQRKLKEFVIYIQTNLKTDNAIYLENINNEIEVNMTPFGINNNSEEQKNENKIQLEHGNTYRINLDNYYKTKILARGFYYYHNYIKSNHKYYISRMNKRRIKLQVLFERFIGKLQMKLSKRSVISYSTKVGSRCTYAYYFRKIWLYRSYCSNIMSEVSLVRHILKLSLKEYLIQLPFGNKYGTRLGKHFHIQKLLQNSMNTFKKHYISSNTIKNSRKKSKKCIIQKNFSILFERLAINYYHRCLQHKSIKLGRRVILRYYLKNIWITRYNETRLIVKFIQSVNELKESCKEFHIINKKCYLQEYELQLSNGNLYGMKLSRKYHRTKILKSSFHLFSTHVRLSYKIRDITNTNDRIKLKSSFKNFLQRLRNNVFHLHVFKRATKVGLRKLLSYYFTKVWYSHIKYTNIMRGFKPSIDAFKKHQTEYITQLRYGR